MLRREKRLLVRLLAGPLVFTHLFVVACSRTPTPLSEPTHENRSPELPELPSAASTARPTMTAPDETTTASVAERPPPVVFTQAEARARSIQYISDRARDGVWPSSIRAVITCDHYCGQLEGSFGCVLRPSSDPDATCPRWTCPFIFLDPDGGTPFALITIVIDGSAIGASPGVELCLEKEHGCAVKVRRKAAMKRLRATREALDIAWSEDEGEFYWVNTDNDKRLSCHGNGR